MLPQLLASQLNLTDSVNNTGNVRRHLRIAPYFLDANLSDSRCMKSFPISMSIPRGTAVNTLSKRALGGRTVFCCGLQQTTVSCLSPLSAPHSSLRLVARVAQVVLQACGHHMYPRREPWPSLHLSHSLGRSCEKCYNMTLSKYFLSPYHTNLHASNDLPVKYDPSLPWAAWAVPHPCNIPDSTN